jgi:hypothetical protein
MARAYTVATAAVALDTTTKWLDNVLSHNTIPGVIQARQGVARRITVEGLLTLSLVLLLTAELDTTIEAAIDIARKMVAGSGTFESPNRLTVRLDLDAFSSKLIGQLEHAVEVAPRPRRGRPPKNKTGRLE